MVFMENFLSIGQAAKLCGVNANTLRLWANTGRIASSRSDGGHRRFRREDLVALIPPKPDRAVVLSDPSLPEVRLEAERRCVRYGWDAAYCDIADGGAAAVRKATAMLLDGGTGRLVVPSAGMLDERDREWLSAACEAAGMEFVFLNIKIEKGTAGKPKRLLPGDAKRLADMIRLFAEEKTEDGERRHGG